ncbi:MAG: type I pullulanase [Clostridia bacterium]|nr:type I pullulanase [Clostridia bacterium]
MKKLTAILLAVLMLCGVFAACTPPKPPVTPTASETTGEETAAPTPTPTPTTEEGYEDYTLAREDGKNQLIFYWKNATDNYEKCDMWIWMPGLDGRGYTFHRCAYGAKVIVNVPADVTEVGFIVRKNCSDPGGTSWGDATKDYDADRFAVITGELTEIYLKEGDGAQYFSSDGGKTLYQKKEFSLAAIISPTEIQYHITPATKFSALDQVKVLCDGEEVPVASLSSLNNTVVQGTIRMKEELDMSKNYTVRLDGFDEKPAVPTKIFDSQAFVENYVYDGDDLGAVIVEDGSTVFKVWAPTASKVFLNLFNDGEKDFAIDSLEMTKGEKGVWSINVPCGHGMYYTYTVTTALGSKETVDPYAKATGVNGNRGMVIDLRSTDPEGFENDRYYDKLQNNYDEAIIWEVHVRDFSNKIESSAYKGKYLAFTETGLKNAAGKPVGIDYVKDLGVTHIHLQPVYDYATVDESDDGPQFNWGYDPKNYNVPEGSYSTDPYNGEVRVNEFKRMVQAIHENGMGVVMDVVYNHTYSLDSCFERTVPYYYYRFSSTGEPSNGSGCGNETASERAMFRKYMVDSVIYWAKEYHIDGFRFDLMALHDIETMQAIETALHEVNPKAIIYGEGWTGGTSALRDNLQAKQTNISQIHATGEGIGAVAVFNDAIRDGLKGSVFDAKGKGYINGDASKLNAGKAAFGLTGGKASIYASFKVDNDMIVNYMSCHDNNTLWDKLLATNPEDSDEARFEMNRLGAAIVMLSKGTPFFLAGEELLRTKQGDHNSYNSSDEINNIDWSVYADGTLQTRAHDFYKGLIALRRSYGFFAGCDVSCEITSDNSIIVKYSEGGNTVLIAIVNPGESASYSIPDGTWRPVLEGETFTDAETARDVSGAVVVAGRSVSVFARARNSDFTEAHS